MPVEYSLIMETEVTPREVLSFLADSGSLEWHDSGYLTAPEIIVGAHEHSQHGPSAEMIIENFDFLPRLLVWFQMAGGTDLRPQGIRIMMRVITLLLRRYTGDVVLLTNGENVKLRRSGGKLLIHKDPNPLYLANFLQEVTLPYELHDLSAPLV